jgi:hypothetical protein
MCRGSLGQPANMVSRPGTSPGSSRFVRQSRKQRSVLADECRCTICEELGDLRQKPSGDVESPEAAPTTLWQLINPPPESRGARRHEVHSHDDGFQGRF